VSAKPVGKGGTILHDQVVIIHDATGGVSPDVVKYKVLAGFHRGVKNLHVSLLHDQKPRKSRGGYGDVREMWGIGIETHYLCPAILVLFVALVGDPWVQMWRLPAQ